MKKKLLLGLLITALSFTTFAACGGSNTSSEEATETAETTEEVTEEAAEDTSADRVKLIVGFDAEYPPYGYMDDNGEYTGFDLECAKLVCEALGWEYEEKPIAWASKDMELNSGSIDCIWNGFSITPERLSEYTWSSAYVDNTQVMVVAADAGIESLEDLAGKNVVVQASSAALEALKGEGCADLTNSFASLNENADYNTAFMNLESGAADAVAIDIGVANYQIEQREAGKYIIIEEPFYTEQYGIGFRLGEEALRDAVEAELLKLVESGRYEELAIEFGIDPDMLCLGK